MFSTKKFSCFLSLLLGIVVACNAEAKTQSITFYQEPGCKGRNETFTVSNFDVSTLWVKNASSYYQDGMWRIFFPSISQPMMTRIVLRFNTGTCHETYIDSTIHRIERYGNVNKEAKEITLFTDRNQNGIYINTNETEYKFERSVMLQSHIMTGNHEWTVFTGMNFDGSTTCIGPSEVVKNNGFGISYNWTEKIPFGSIRYGCSFQPNLKSSLLTIALVFVGVLFVK